MIRLFYICRNLITLRCNNKILSSAIFHKGQIITVFPKILYGTFYQTCIGSESVSLLRYTTPLTHYQPPITAGISRRCDIIPLPPTLADDIKHIIRIIPPVRLRRIIGVFRNDNKPSGIIRCQRSNRISVIQFLVQPFTGPFTRIIITLPSITAIFTHGNQPSLIGISRRCNIIIFVPIFPYLVLLQSLSPPTAKPSLTLVGQTSLCNDQSHILCNKR